MKKLTRQRFLSLLTVGAGGSLFLPKLSFGSTESQIDKDMVKKFVLYSHKDIAIVKPMLEEKPELIHVAWDWGNGDFETALGAASHVGNKELARYLLSEGARINIFTAAMLGETKLVKKIIEVFPLQLWSKGPHNLDLLHHAKQGGDEAAETLEYIEKAMKQIQKKY